MRYETYRAFSRAWVSTCERGEFRLPQLLEKVCGELFHTQRLPLIGLALFVRDATNVVRIGVAGRTEFFSEPALLGLFHEMVTAEREVRIIDHIIDSGWYLGESIRVSMLARSVQPCGLTPNGEVGVWIGLGRDGAASEDLQRKVSDISQSASDWLRDHSPVIGKWRTLHSVVEDLRSKEYDLRVIAHDARAPLGTLLRYSRDYSASIRGSECFNEIVYLKELLDALSARVRGEVSSQRRDASLLEVIDRVRMRFLNHAKDKGLELRVRAENSGKIGLSISSLVLERVLSNLVENSIRYTTSGVVEISMRNLEADIVIEVRDTGNGFPEHVMRELLDVNREAISGSHGWGVGLLSAKRAVEREGGRIFFGSSENGGALVTVVVPPSREVSRSDAMVETPSPTLLATKTRERGRLVLLIDDDAEHVSSLSRALRAYGIESVEAYSVADALELLASVQVSAILCDAHMPDGGAESLLQALRVGMGHHRVAVMSGDSDDDQLYQLASKGAEAFFPKPVDLAAIKLWIGADSHEDQPSA